ncbi:DNA-binding transcriptional regulator, XRE-family HTH domain [Bosea sp. CRIB-10]|uniref:helix-turn-helix domain-containing protein n=1 Tax=Bosea sp. CRIB-10 TaxID=378404 RepID=UPI0008ED804F|nr:helix-turn-helix domain-containing protein [Bosea sp. CRIB-10]SFD13785.1 DNA-binding transcriptional regulator, XRE-family HTH domain [Bosea sp. CRIB-10]
MEKQPRNEIYREIGRRVRERRDELGHDQDYIATALGVSQQQVSKLENGKNRLSLMQLLTIAKVLDVGAGYFLDSLAPMILAAGASDAEQARYSAPPVSAERQKLARAFDQLKSPEDRKLALELLEFAARRQKQGR